MIHTLIEITAKQRERGAIISRVPASIQTRTAAKNVRVARNLESLLRMGQFMRQLQCVISVMKKHKHHQ